MEFVSSLVAVVGLADQVISCCRRYVSAVKDCPSDLRLILVETSCLKSVIQNLEFLYENSPDLDLRDSYLQLDGTNGLLKSCRECLQKLDELLPDGKTQGAMGRTKGSVEVTIQRLAWPLRETKAKKLLSELGSLRASISLALAADSSRLLQNVNANVQYLCDQLDRDTRNQILRWLVITDPSSYHNSTCALREENTGTWLQKSSEYNDWKQGRTPLIWFHGIPGAGKTVLFSHIVEDIKALCSLQGSRGMACVYYYCYFGRNQDESHPFVRWTINQLARRAQYIPANIKQHFDADQQPSLPVLIDALAELAMRCERIYLLVDALDESTSRSNLIQVLQSLNTSRFRNVSILTMSREETDIKFAMKYATQSVSVSLSNSYVDEDIAIYIRSELAIKPRLRLYPVEVKQEIERALIRGAQGMFRWAACQIEILSRLHTLADLRTALINLPRTLEELYQRILVSIPWEHRERAKKALLLLSGEDISPWFKFSNPSILAEAIAVNIDEDTFDQKDKILQPSDFLQEICSCLVRLDETDPLAPRLRMAHYTVKEYLYSDRIKETEAGYFQCTRESAIFLASMSSITYLLNISYVGVPSAGDYLISSADEQTKYSDTVRLSFPFLDDANFWAQYWWQKHESNVQNPALSMKIDRLLMRLFWPGEKHQLRWLEWRASQIPQNIFPLWIDWETREASIAFIIASSLGAIRVAALILQTNPLVAEDRSTFSINPTYARYHQQELKLNRLSNPTLCFEDSELFGVEEPSTSGTLLEVLALAHYPECFKLLASVSPTIYGYINSAGYSILSMVFRKTNYVSGLLDRRALVDVLIQLGAQVNPNPVSETPLQSAARALDASSVRLLLHAGALVNNVVDDDVVVNKIKQGFKTELEKRDEALLGRGQSQCYKTPLRIALDQTKKMDEIPSGRRIMLKRAAEDVIKILEEHGGLALCLFPVPNLPGYQAEDWECLREAQWHGVGKRLLVASK